MSSATEKIKLLYVSTVPFSLFFLKGRAVFLRLRGFDVRALSSPGELLEKFSLEEEVRIHSVKMHRRISPIGDLKSLLGLVKILRDYRPHIVHALTPKAGLLGMMASRLTGVPVRIYDVLGLPLLDKDGVIRQLLEWSETLSCSLAHLVLCDSPSIREIMVKEGLCSEAKIAVLHHGSVNGIDAMGRFNPSLYGRETPERIRRHLGIPMEAVVVGFVGRIVRDKGVIELAKAWTALRREFGNAFLVMVGPLEKKDAVPSEILAALEEDDRVAITGFVNDVVPFYTAFDLVVLPSHREGFPVAPLEAAAMGLPVVATRIPGCVDAVVDGENGLLVPPGDGDALAESIGRYLRNPDLGRKHGRVGRRRALRYYRPETIWEALYNEYSRLLEKNGICLPCGTDKPPG